MSPGSRDTPSLSLKHFENGLTNAYQAQQNNTTLLIVKTKQDRTETLVYQEFVINGA